MLAGQVRRRLAQRQPERLGRRCLRADLGDPGLLPFAGPGKGAGRAGSLSCSVTAPVSPLGSAARARGRRGRDSRCAPRSRVRRGRAGGARTTHLALFQKYRCGTSSRAGPPCSLASGSPFVVPHHPRLAAGHVGQREVGRVAGVRRGQHIAGRRHRPGRRQQRVDGHTVERDAELRPGRDAVDVARVVRARQRLDLVPGPFDRLLDQPLDVEGPGGGGQARGGFGGEHGPVRAHVVLAGRQPRVTCPAPAEPSREDHALTFPLRDRVTLSCPVPSRRTSSPPAALSARSVLLLNYCTAILNYGTASGVR